MTKCKYLDPTCPCQDGDTCHYEGEEPMMVPADRAQKLVAVVEAVKEMQYWAHYLTPEVEKALNDLD